ASFKQEDGVIYNARDMAVVRGRTAGVPVILATATPSLETVFNIQNGRYQKLSLPERHGGASLPKVFVVDMKAESLGTDNYISAELEKQVADTFNANQQSMLFLNRRGYAPLTLCRNCGHRITCSHCTAWLVEHRLKGKLECHHCGSSRFLPKECPNCSAKESLVPIGPGVERLAEEVVRKFPSARVEIMTSDTIRSPSTASCFINRMQRAEIDILIGTQIVAKGHHFPNLTLVGVVDADLGLSGGDLRASERVYQTLQQVAGRAGRADREGSVILQTYQPENPIIQAMVSGDRDRFLDLEGKAREHYEMPPYGRLAALIISGENISRVKEAVNGIGKARPTIPGLQVLGPAEAPLSILRGRHRRRFLIKARPGVRIQPVIQAWLSRSRIQSGVRVQIDIDPYSFM
ncbi:MAG: replication restart helicase PriA, partial [Alphaproteobacteria bacterium]